MRKGWKMILQVHTIWKIEGESSIIFSVYVDDQIYTSNLELLLKGFKRSMEEGICNEWLGDKEMLLGSKWCKIKMRSSLF